MNVSMAKAAQAFEAEHQQLEVAIAEIRRWWDQAFEIGQPHFGEMGDRLLAFREMLSSHFRHEEETGVLEFVMSSPTEQICQLAGIRDEHAELIDELDVLIGRLTASEPDFAFWGEAGAEFELFLGHLADHEQAEAAIVKGNV